MCMVGSWSKAWQDFLALADVKHSMNVQLLFASGITVFSKIFSFGFLANWGSLTWVQQGYLSGMRCLHVSALYSCCLAQWLTCTSSIWALVATLWTPSQQASQWVTFPGGCGVRGLPRSEVQGQMWDNAVTTALHSGQWTLGTPGSEAR